MNIIEAIKSGKPFRLKSSFRLKNNNVFPNNDEWAIGISDSDTFRLNLKSGCIRLESMQLDQFLCDGWEVDQSNQTPEPKP